MAHYIIRDVSPEEYKDMKDCIPMYYYRTKLAFDEKAAFVTCEEGRRNTLPKILKINGSKYHYRYSSKRETVGIFVKSGGIEKYALNDILLSADEQKVVRELYLNFKAGLNNWRKISDTSASIPESSQKNLFRRVLDYFGFRRSVFG